MGKGKAVKFLMEKLPVWWPDILWLVLVINSMKFSIFTDFSSLSTVNKGVHRQCDLNLSQKIRQNFHLWKTFWAKKTIHFIFHLIRLPFHLISTNNHF